MHNQNSPSGHQSLPADSGFSGYPWLVEERDACGVGFVAHREGKASHSIVEQALQGLTCLEHRGGCSADRDSGDGAGLMTAVPWQLLPEYGIPRQNIGVAMVFLPQGGATAIAKKIIEESLGSSDLKFLGWRQVPVNPDVLGPQARQNQPQIEQLFVASSTLNGDALERQLYLARKRMEQAINATKAAWCKDFYVCSFSNRTIVYKGMVRSVVLKDFYLDLQNPDYISVFAVYHRRFSTNTMPKWPLAQPMRFLGHNGEINTLLGNINWMRARQAQLAHPVWSDTFGELLPIVNAKNSDSANLDNALELLVQSGRQPLQGMMMLVPEAYQNQPDLVEHPEIVDFYEFYSGLQEAWDGPALIVFSDGHVVGATLDRNGLRPARYTITQDGLVIVGSEAGVIPVEEANVLEKGRLGPGQMIAVDLQNHELLTNWQIKQRVAAHAPYGEWLKTYRQDIEPQAYQEDLAIAPPDYLQQQMAFGYGAEDVEMVIEAMAKDGKEPTFCMGDDIPLAVLSERPHLLYNYFKQRFAQVTNPPIDPLREKLVMSLVTRLGARGNLLDEQGSFARLLQLNSPLINEAELTQIMESDFGPVRLSTQYPLAAGPTGLEKAVGNLCQQAIAAVRQGAEILVLSDRHDGAGTLHYLDAETTFIPPLLAVGAVHHSLISQGIRRQVSLVVETAQCWSTHHFACLIGYGAGAICPYLTWETIRQWWHSDRTQNLFSKGKLAPMDLQRVQANYRKSIEDGLLKILSKMGISLVASYRGAQIFEAIGIGSDLLQLGFIGTTSRVGGLSITDLAQETVTFHSKAFPEMTSKKLKNYGFVQFRPGGEYHMNNPEMAKALHKAVADKNYDHYEVYRQQLTTRIPTALRDLLEFQSDRPSIDLDQVEPASEIAKRFCTGGMSLGALSREAHEVLAIAMNRLGAKSNSGEGGEDPVRFEILEDVDKDGHSPQLPHLNGLRNGDTANSAIKQVASGRFGVTPEYLSHGKQIEIKMAQGAKPGEGGQLPGPKVSPYIAMLRRSKPGVPLISPPPHHDIYSIEDLAQLIFDLHQINPQAKVSVKLVAEIGIGTIAAGVAKANADVIQISGHDGGTGASPLSSIKHAGSPWELGLTEVHRVLLENQLRDRVTLRVDGGLKCGWDVIMGALMGAEEFGFGSAAMIAEGCIMARICHTNNCPVGVATQKEELRKRFPGIPDHVVNFFLFIAEEVRSILAKLGYSSLNEIIGRSDILTPRADVHLQKTQSLNLDCLTQLPDTRSDRQWLVHEAVHSNGDVLDDRILAEADVQTAICEQQTVEATYGIVNTDRTVGARIAGAIARKYGNTGFEGQLTLNFEGSAGQSFGAFNLPGMILKLVGEANDYVGKGMHGGELIITPKPDAPYAAADNVIIGNTCLYGATGGVLYANGRAGERFAVRNSKGTAVVEGTGDHCCEYMTGGVVVVLGTTGRNVGAGMTGGLAYILDETHTFPAKVNPEIVKLQRVVSPAGQTQLRNLIQAHSDRTGSPRAQEILSQWDTYLPQFWQVVPPSEADSPEANPEMLSQAETATDKVLTPVQ
ncbi:glutamate synthase-related protein [Candidatus Synechococcus calcipolaris G9]|uniref:Glutamate synthase-related protein n=1 Tax=Candidatus Synechococcus calcipolaris G9 TaxID=1497997 RepID=A0ABT6EWH4_9SYNE|nr:glutamate synthase-related protein [Candidatus Synechococcus calcipolaris]MDG2990103.1 glutamate synthase-related protein [Candidatus Synechococcus calcipolaris G9]